MTFFYDDKKLDDDNLKDLWGKHLESALKEISISDGTDNYKYFKNNNRRNTIVDPVTKDTFFLYEPKNVIENLDLVNKELIECIISTHDMQNDTNEIPSITYKVSDELVILMQNFNSESQKNIADLDNKILKGRELKDLSVKELEIRKNIITDGKQIYLTDQEKFAVLFSKVYNELDAKKITSIIAKLRVNLMVYTQLFMQNFESNPKSILKFKTRSIDWNDEIQNETTEPTFFELTEEINSYQKNIEKLQTSRHTEKQDKAFKKNFNNTANISLPTIISKEKIEKVKMRIEQAQEFEGIEILNLIIEKEKDIKFNEVENSEVKIEESVEIIKQPEIVEGLKLIEFPDLISIAQFIEENPNKTLEFIYTKNAMPSNERKKINISEQDLEEVSQQLLARRNKIKVTSLIAMNDHMEKNPDGHFEYNV